MRFNFGYLLFILVLCSFSYNDHNIFNNEIKNFTSLNSISLCPEGFTYDANWDKCYLLLNPTTFFDALCPYEDSLFFGGYKNYLPENIQIWAPVSRSNLGIFTWMEPSLLYGTNFESQYHIEEPIKDKNCTVYDSSTKEFSATDCNSKHHRFCAYNTIKNLKNQRCAEKNWYQSDFNAASSCFYVDDSIESNKKKAEFIKPYQNYIFDETCLFGLEKLNGNIIWSSTNQSVNYNFWFQEIFDEDGIYGVFSPEGWTLVKSETEVSCMFYEEEIEIVEPFVSLTLNEANTTILVTVENISGLYWINNTKPLLYCFTDASAENLVYRYGSLEEQPVENQNTRIYQLSIFPNKSGNYWCEYMTYPAMEIKKSNDILLHPEEFTEFVVILQFAYVSGSDPLSIATLHLYGPIVFLKFYEHTNSEKENVFRNMKFVSFDETNHFVTINTHLSISTGLKNTYNEIYSILQTIIADIPTLNITLIELLNVEYCYEEKTEMFTWPKTKRGEIAYPKELCFVCVSRLCDGNFIDGAKWANVEENCGQTWLPSGNISEDLKCILDSRDSGKISLERIANLSYSFAKFSVNDLNLSALILINIQNEADMNVSNLVEVINNLLQIDSDTIFQAQETSNSSSLILSATNTISLNNFIESYQNPALEFFQLFTKSIEHPQKNYDCLLTTTDKVELGLDYKLQNLANWNCAILVSVYSKNVFFVNSTDSQMIGPVFWVNFVNECKDTTIQINYPVQNSKETFYCDSWQFENRLWQDTGNLSINSGLLICEYSSPGILALRKKINNDDVNNNNNTSSNLTQDLGDLINSNATTDEIIDKLLNISTQYEEYNQHDVYLTGKLLEKISVNSKINKTFLGSIAEIVSNMHDINRQVLFDSQQVNKSTDLILYNVDQIINSYIYEEPIEIVTKNFLVLVSTLENVQGVVLHQSTKSEINYTLMSRNSDPLSKFKDVETAVVFSEDLINQYGNDTKIIVTFHSTDALFNENKNNSRVVSKIFGIILPELVECYQGPLYVYHNLSMGDFSDDCVHWNYDQSANKSGKWLSDPYGRSIGQLFQCEYWHTTHFALLLSQNAPNLPLLDLITIVNCSLSGFGLCGIILTAVLFKRWRTNTGNQILLNFVFAISIQIATFYISDAINDYLDDDLSCTIIGVVLHYSLISQFCWMFIIAILQFKRFVEVLGRPPKYVLVKACLCGWVLPLLPVVCVFALDIDNYSHGNVGLCYPSGLGLYLGVWLPIVIIVAINTVTFIYIMYNVRNKKTECVRKDTSDILAQWRLAILLFFMLGLTWSFGFLGQMDYGDVFIYLFCWCATLQGFIMFLFFIVFNKTTRLMYRHLWKTKLCKNM